MVEFRVMTSRLMADYIKGIWSGNFAIPKGKGNLNPKIGIRSVSSVDLPEELNCLVNQIMASESVFDMPSAFGEENTTLAPKTLGKMRSIHGNKDGWLPIADDTKSLNVKDS